MQRFLKCKLLFLITLTYTLLSGCVISPPVQPNDPYYAPVLQTRDVQDKPINGSLYSPNSSLVLFTDLKAKRVGDILTVTLRERTSSSKSSNIEVTKDNDVSISPAAASGTILGSTPSLGSLGLTTGLIGEREFTGEAEADQSNQLSGEITVTVTNVMPNGNLIVRGEKWITLNRGDEYIRISGMVRQEDISPDNIVMSNKIADARITYSGTGDFADSQDMGWLTRFFNSPIWPF